MKQQILTVGFMCNVMIGLLHGEHYSEPYLLMNEELIKCNSQTVGQLFNDAIITYYSSSGSNMKMFFYLLQCCTVMKLKQLTL